MEIERAIVHEGLQFAGLPVPATSVIAYASASNMNTFITTLQADNGGVSYRKALVMTLDMHTVRRGAGKPILLIHGLGGSWKSWSTISDQLAAEREVIAIDLPGFGATAPLDGEVSISTLSDAVTGYLRANGMLGIDAVGSSMGARLVLELARRGGVLGGVVSLDPGGFWQGWQRHAFYASIYASIRLVRVLQPAMPFITRHALTRSLLLAQFSARPWRLAPETCLDEMRSYAASPSFDELLWHLAYGETQQGAPLGSIKSPLVIGWGKRDRVCFTSQAKRALELFPDASMHWFKHSGHFPHWDEPQATAQLILNELSPEGTQGRRMADVVGTVPRGLNTGVTDGLNPGLNPQPAY